MSITAERLNEAMVLRGVDQSELARVIGVTQGAISKIAVGKTSNSRLLPRIATQLGVSLPWLLGNSNSMEDDAFDIGISFQERDWVNTLRNLEPGDRAAIIKLTSSLGRSVAHPTATVHSPRVEYSAES